MSAAQSLSALDGMLTELASAVARTAGADRPREVAQVLGRYVPDPDLLASCHCAPSDDRYARHMLAEDSFGRYAVAALVWKPGQMSRVHSHRVWCALGIHRGVLTETAYDPGTDGDPPEPKTSRLCRPGDVSYGAPDPGKIHRIANLGCGAAISIHVYGIRFAEFPTGVNFLLSET